MGRLRQSLAPPQVKFHFRPLEASVHLFDTIPTYQSPQLLEAAIAPLLPSKLQPSQNHLRSVKILTSHGDFDGCQECLNEEHFGSCDGLEVWRDGGGRKEEEGVDREYIIYLTQSQEKLGQDLKLIIIEAARRCWNVHPTYAPALQQERLKILILTL